MGTDLATGAPARLCQGHAGHRHRRSHHVEASRLADRSRAWLRRGPEDGVVRQYRQPLHRPWCRRLDVGALTSHREPQIARVQVDLARASVGSHDAQRGLFVCGKG